MALQEPVGRLGSTIPRICRCDWPSPLWFATFFGGRRESRKGVAALSGVYGGEPTPPQLRLELPIGDCPQFRGLLYDLFQAVQMRAQVAGLALDSLGDPATLASSLEDELNANRAFLVRRTRWSIRAQASG
jgi:hypothetical protein